MRWNRTPLVWALCAAAFGLGCEDEPPADVDAAAPDAATPDAGPACDSADPVCDPGCADDEICNTACACEPRGCQPDAPVCEPGCADDEVCNASCACEAAPPPPPDDLLRRPSRSTAVDVDAEDRIVAMADTDSGQVSLFSVAAAGEESRVARVQSSAEADGEPVAVVIHPDGERVFVANRAAGTVAVIEGIDTAGAERTDEVDIGGEPMGLALTPTGAQLWVTDWTAGTVTVLDTDDLSEIRRHVVGGNPFAIAITHDGDTEDDDEKVFVTQFFGRHEGREALDDGRTGIVQVLDVGGDGPARTIELAPLADCFTAPVGDDLITSGCFPNQLNGVTIHRAFDRTLAYVTSVAAGPAGPVNFNHNMQALVSVIDVDAEEELRGRAVNLNTLVKAQEDPDEDETRGRRFVNVPNGIAFVNRDDLAIGYVSSAGSDAVFRVAYDPEGGAALGAASAFNIPVGQNPLGIVTRHGAPDTADAFTANLISRDLSAISFRDQRQIGAVESSATPSEGSADFARWKGKRFFNTSTGIWSREGWGSCQSCHPMGLTDNVTWSFAAGPRQSISMDGQYASDDPTDMRALNWTAIFDEVHDFELNTRGVSGGRGAIQGVDGPLVSDAGPPFAALEVIAGIIENHQALNGSLTAVTRDPEICANGNTCPDWDLIDAYVQSIRSPRGKPASAAVAERGRGLFEEGGCTKCHAGPKWTISRTFYDVTATDGGGLGERVFATNAAAAAPMDPSTLVGLPADVNVDATLIAGDDSDGGAPALKRQACNIRAVGTFGADGGADEVRANGQPAQGPNGFNPPSLLGLAVGAPYLHNGAAPTLDGLLADHPEHTTAGNPNFLPTADDRAALVAFLLSIDESTPIFPIEDGTVLCPDDFAP